MGSQTKKKQTAIPSAAQRQPSLLQLALPSSQALQSSEAVSVAAVVAVSVLDHFQRRKDGQTRILGALLGARSTDPAGRIVAHASNCFPLSYSQTPDNKIVVDVEYLSRMYALHQRVNPKETIVGWYTSGSMGLDDNSVWINEVVAGETAPAPPVVLLVNPEALLDVKKTGGDGDVALSFPIRAFVGVPAGVTLATSSTTDTDAETIEKTEASDADRPGTLFLEIPTINEVQGVDRVGLDMIARAITSMSIDASAQPTEAAAPLLPASAVNTPITSDIDALETAVRAAHATLTAASDYVDTVLAADTLPSPASTATAVGRFLLDTVSTIPPIDPAEFTHLFNGHVQDTLMVLYLANLTRTQLSIAERLHKMG